MRSTGETVGGQVGSNKAMQGKPQGNVTMVGWELKETHIHPHTEQH